MLMRRTPFFKFSIIFLCILLVPLLIGGWSAIPKSVGQFRNWSIVFFGAFALSLFFASIRKGTGEFLRGRQEPTPQELLWLRNAVVAIFSIALSKATLIDYGVFHVNGVDFSIYDHAMMNTLRGRFMESFDGLKHMGVHSTYVLLGLLPLHASFHHPIFSLLLEPLLLASAAVPIWKLSAKLRGSTRIALLISYFLSTWVAKNLHYHFHVEVFYVPFFLWLHLFVQNKNLSKALGMSLLICLTKEDGPFYLLGYWAAIFLSGPFSKKTATWTSIAIAGFLILNLKWAMPEFRDGSTYALAGRMAAYGNNFSEIVQNLPQVAVQIIRNFLVGEWWKSLALLLFLPLLTFYSAVPLIIILGIYSVGGQAMGGLLLYDSAPLIPFFWIGWMELVAGSSGPTKLRDWLSSRETPISWTITVLILTVGSGYLVFRPMRLNEALETHARLEQISPHETVCAQTALIPHLRYPKESYPIGQACIDNPQVTLYALSAQYSAYPHPPETVQNWMELLKKRADLRCEELRNLLLCRKIAF